jgi:hypothetical protein
MTSVRTTRGIDLAIAAPAPRRGGESAVYDATGPFGACVVKVAHEPLPFGAWLEAERELLASLGEDPATAEIVPRVIGHGIWDDRPFVALERFASTLEDPTTARDPLARLAPAARVAEVVAQLHAARPDLVHRDLKPSNFLIDGDRLVVTDFGIARETHGRTTTTRALFTPDYAAPEQMLPHRSANRSWDVFGLAATLFHVVVGEAATAPGMNAWRRTTRGLLLRAGRDEGRGEPGEYLDFRAMEALTASDRQRLSAAVRGPLRRAILEAMAPDARRRRGTAAGLAAAARASRPVAHRARWPLGLAVAGTAAIGLSATAALRTTRGPDYPVVPIPGDGTIAPFFLGEYEVTQETWRALQGDRLETRRPLDPRGLGASCASYEGIPLIGDRLPMVCISFLDAVRFANRMSARDGLASAYHLVEDAATGEWTAEWQQDASGWRLPTRAEWRAGIEWPGGLADPCAENGADDVFFFYFPPGRGKTCGDGYTGLAPVGSFPPGPHGVRDGYGNASEWLWDPAGDGRLVGEGGWTTMLGVWTPADESTPQPPWFRGVTIGMRLARNQ